MSYDVSCATYKCMLMESFEIVVEAASNFSDSMSQPQPTKPVGRVKKRSVSKDFLKVLFVPPSCRSSVISRAQMRNSQSSSQHQMDRAGHPEGRRVLSGGRVRGGRSGQLFYFDRVQMFVSQPSKTHFKELHNS